MKHYCRVNGCRFKFTHTTSGHRCGVPGCKDPYGHGQMEHYDIEAKEKLKQYWHETMPQGEQCDIWNCTHKHNHSRTAHVCERCGERGTHSASDCIIKPLDEAIIQWNLNRDKINEFLNTRNNIIFQINVGMGCSLFVSAQDNNFQTIFMHSDSWGQYGPQTDDTPKLRRFEEDLTNVTGQWIQFNYREPVQLNETKKCPVCRTENTPEDIKYIKGLDSKCIVCYENNIEVYFSACEHTVICKSCLNKLE